MSVEKSAGAVVFTQHHFSEELEGQRGYTRRNSDKRNGAGFSKEDNQVYYLLLHYEAGHWSFPKGNIEQGESIKQTAIRETEEETGINDLKFLEGFKEWIKYFYKIEGENRFKIVTYLLAKTEQKQVKLSHEHIGYKWLPYEEALNQLTYDNAKEVLKKAHSFIKEG